MLALSMVPVLALGVVTVPPPGRPALTFGGGCDEALGEGASVCEDGPCSCESSAPDGLGAVFGTAIAARAHGDNHRTVRTSGCARSASAEVSAAWERAEARGEAELQRQPAMDVSIMGGAALSKP